MTWCWPREKCEWGKGRPCAMTTTKGHPDQNSVAPFFLLLRLTRSGDETWDHAQAKNTTWANGPNSELNNLICVSNKATWRGRKRRCLRPCTLCFLRACFSVHYHYRRLTFGYWQYMPTVCLLALWVSQDFILTLQKSFKNVTFEELPLFCYLNQWLYMKS